MTTPQNPEQRPPAFAGFWRRLAAWVLDVFALGLVGWVLGLVLANALAAMGPWGRVFGFLVASQYFAVLDSHWGQGQSLGKRLMGIRVLSSSGQFLTPWQAGLRFVPVGLPWFFNGAAFAPSLLSSWLIYPLTAVILGLALSQLYLSVFNRPSRQLIHDVWLSTVVVPAGQRQVVQAAALSRMSLSVCALLCVASGFAPWAIQRWAQLQGADLNALAPVQDAVMAVPGVLHAQVGIGEGWTQTNQSERRNWTYLSVKAGSRTPDIQSPVRLQAMARAALQAYPSGQQRDVLSVRLCHGYDIGIATKESCEQRNASPAEWLAGS